MATPDATVYEKLARHFRRIGQLGEVAAIVEWDQAVNMPAAAGPARADAMATVASLSHDLRTQAWLGDALAAAELQRDLGAWERANLKEMSRAWRRATAVPGDLVEASTKAEKTCEQAWRQCRAANDFMAFAPLLESVVALKIQVAQALAEHLGCSPYDALLDEYEPGARAEDIDVIFAELRAFLPSFTEQVIEHQRAEAPIVPLGPFPLDQQRALAQELMLATGFDLSIGRLDTSHHPFCGGVPRDVRLTTRYDERDFTSAIMGVLHEAGHGKYEQALPAHWEHSPVGQARGMLIHESQSLLQEMQVCRSPEFLRFAAPGFRTAFPEQSRAQPLAYTPQNLASLYTRVKRSFIRVDADEVTYPSHVLLRYEIERDLLGGKLRVRDLPEAWDTGMRLLLSVSTLGNDRDGCMQDVHWPSGAFGYFPLYTLGAMAAAQLYEHARRAVPAIPEAIAAGNFGLLNDWLRQHIWARASSVSTQQLLTDATGEPLNSHYFIHHLQRRYLPRA
ncbi:MAG: hypothetical protein RJA70_1663 [Pseudomonadota bacterium]|jgi:carboxypeptidase Taq